MIAKLPCPYPECTGSMEVTSGQEVARMLRCSQCGYYYYKVGAIVCTCTRVCNGELLPPNDNQQWCNLADILLDAPKGQSLKPEILAKMEAYKQKWQNLGFSNKSPCRKKRTK